MGKEDKDKFNCDDFLLWLKKVIAKGGEPNAAQVRELKFNFALD
jgi:hypothetical protein